MMVGKRSGLQRLANMSVRVHQHRDHDHHGARHDRDCSCRDSCGQANAIESVLQHVQQV